MAKRRGLLGRKTFKVKLKKTTVYSLAAVLLFSLAGLVWLSFLRQGLLLTQLNQVILDQLGLIPALFLPFPLIVGGLMVSKIKVYLSEPHVFVGSVIVIAALTGIFRSGYVGASLWANVGVFLSSPGAFVFFLTGLVLGVIIMLNIPFEDLVNILAQVGTRLPSSSSVAVPANSSSQIKLSGMTQTIPPQVNSKLPVSRETESEKVAPVQIHPPAAAANSPWHYPPLSLLSENISGKADRGNVNNNAAVIESTLEAFGITAKVVEVNLGPAVTQYALEVAIGTKLSKINALSNDLALALAAPTGQIRIEAPIPGRSLVGIELPNRAPEFVSLRKILDHDKLKHHKSKLAVALGLDVSGEPVISDISRMPHILIAGQTGSGK